MSSNNILPTVPYGTWVRTGLVPYLSLARYYRAGLFLCFVTCAWIWFLASSDAAVACPLLKQ